MSLLIYFVIICAFMLFLRYAIVENLRYMLSAYNTSEPMYFGCLFKPFVKQGYMSGGAGYVLSREALKRFIEQALPDKTKCRQDHGGAEDLEIGERHFLYYIRNQQDANLAVSFICHCKITLHVSDAFCVHPQEY